ncbi:MAG TPA: DUF305 domain-containing protein [Vineibacter sp.]|nr:DUF305 domain-containing protein [Vineibacter sp.]
MQFFQNLALGFVLGIAGAAVAQDRHADHQHASVPPLVISTEVPFATLMTQAMDRMHADMAAARPTGDPDRDFLAMMIPHHQGAVDMAKIVLLHTQDPRIRNLAQSIITEQQYEIALMRNMLSASAPNPPATK